MVALAYWRYYPFMKPLMIVTVFWYGLLCATSQAGEQLPDRALTLDDEQEEQMQERFAAPLMQTDELEGLYLQSPIEIGNESREGLSAVKDESLYSESDALLRERQQISTPNNDPSRTIDRSSLPSVPVGKPIQQL